MLNTRPYGPVVLSILTASLFALPLGLAQDLKGKSQAEVLQILGEPDGKIEMFNDVILTFKGTKVTFRDDKAVEIKGFVPAPSAPPKSAPSGSGQGPSAPNEQTEEGWMTSYDEALKEAKNSGKLVLMDFTGSDWCSWCIKLDNEIFSKPEFKAYAEKNLILLKLDFPKKKTQSAALTEQNKKLAQEFEIKGYPTVIIADATGKKVGQLGYMAGGPAPFIAALQKIKG